MSSSPYSLRTFRTLLRGVRGYLFGRRGGRRIWSWRLFYRLRAVMILYRGSSTPSAQRIVSARVWADRRAFHRIEKLLKRAHRSIVIEMFIWRDDPTGRRIAWILLRCAERGVDIHIVKEASGDVFELDGDDFLGTKSAKRGLWQRFWSHPRIHVKHEAHLNHAKVFLIDDRVLLLTGMNIGDEYRLHWHDYMVELTGENIVRQYLLGESNGTRQTVKLFGGVQHRRAMRTHVMQLLASAHTSIVLEQAYVSDPQVVRSLIDATQRGIDVLLILPSSPDVHHNANMQTVGYLMQGGDRRHLKIMLYPGMVHAKVILVDQRTVFIGSTNLIRSSLDDMGEVNVLLHDRPKRFLNKLKAILLKDTLRSRSLTDPPSFPMVRRLLAWFQL